MFKILEKKELSPGVFRMVIDAPRIAKKHSRGSSLLNALMKKVKGFR